MHLVRSSAPILALLAASVGCYAVRYSHGGWQGGRGGGGRRVDATDIAAPPGYRVEAVATGLTFPSGVAVDELGRVYVLESGSTGEVFALPRLLRIEREGKTTLVAEGQGGPWTGVSCHGDAFYISEGAQLTGGRILKVSSEGAIEVLVDGLPSVGEHHTDRPVVGPDGYLYFGQGTATNSGVVGEDAAAYGWLSRFPEFHDIPARDVVLTGENFTTKNPFEPGSPEDVTTGAFVAFGTRTSRGQRIPGRLPATGAIMRFHLDGPPGPRQLELVAWGIRNPYGLAFAPDGRLFATDNGYDTRGSRPIFAAPDLLWEVKPGGTWYGWPDFAGARPVTEKRFQGPGGEGPRFLLAEHPGAPPEPAAQLGCHASTCGLDFARSARFGHEGDAFIAEFGDAPTPDGTALAPSGFKVVRVDVATGAIRDFLMNADPGPASASGGGGLERPIDVRFDASGDALYVADFGVLEASERGSTPRRGTGVVWKVTRASKPGGAR
jgi:glucose/arabinose dehydrogenase